MIFQLIKNFSVTSRVAFIQIICFYIASDCYAQKNKFPESWSGNWKGELQWFKPGKPEPKTVNMELRIHPVDSTDIFTWQIIYGSASEDNRPYVLKAKNKSAGHWVIDELNGIVLDQYWAGGKFSGVFSVQNSTILNSYWIKDDELHVEFYSLGAKPVSVTGHGTPESPSVDSYAIYGYQKAVLRRMQ